MFNKADVNTPSPILNPRASGVDGVGPLQVQRLASPPRFQSPLKLPWEPAGRNEVPSRQGTLDSNRSTVASESDNRLPLAWSPEVGLPGRLSLIQEKRGWRFFFRHTLKVPLIFTLGSLFGAALTVAMLLSLGRTTSEEPRYTLPSVVVPKTPYPATQPPKTVPVSYMEAQAFNNSCLIKNLVIPDGPRSFDACAFVIRSTDEVWNIRGDVDSAIDKYFHEQYLDAGSWGRRIVGKKDLRDAILTEMQAFPDIKIHITDCVCKGNDNDGYKCAMPDILTGTNLGPSAYGPPTGRYARWTGLVESFVKRNPVTGQWQYYAEWGVHDEWALIQQLGLDFERVQHPKINNEPLHDCSPLLNLNSAPSVDKDDVRDQETHEATQMTMFAS